MRLYDVGRLRAEDIEDVDGEEEGPPPKSQEELYEELIVAVKRGRYETAKYGKISAFASIAHI